jgi:ABC-type nitrate/sulfonate/bicarbonate transport system substrate-binding protein
MSTSLTIALEWFKNPDHLPMIAGIELGWFEEAGYAVELIEPEGHYDGLEAALNGEVHFACNEPLHMLDRPRPGLKALGCFFETEGGILLKREAVERLRNGGKIRIASPVSEFIPDSIACEILNRWAEGQGFRITDEQVQIEPAGFEHLSNLQAGFDAAWLCFANFEGVEAKQAGLDHVLISSNDVGLENFSALELFAGERFLAEHLHIARQVTDILARGAAFCKDDPARARELYYQHTGEAPNELMDAIIADTCPRLVTEVKADPQRWKALWQQFSDMGLSHVDAAGFDSLYTPIKREGKVYRMNG